MGAISISWFQLDYVFLYMTVPIWFRSCRYERTMNGNDAKPWDRPWSMDEIIEQSDKWNLAGDAALLATVSNFANVIRLNR